MTTDLVIDDSVDPRDRMLYPGGATTHEKTAETKVWVLNRGGGVYEDMYDSQPYEIPEGKWVISYAAALHFRNRAVVPGTRGGYQSQGLAPKQMSRIAILRPVDWDEPLDRPENCVPFTAEQLARMYGAVEALNRSSFDSPAARQVRVIQTEDGLKAVYARGLDPERQSKEERQTIKGPKVQRREVDDKVEAEREAAAFAEG
jgi:hypothetical protein